MSAAHISVPDSAFLTFMTAKVASGKGLMKQAYEKADGNNVQYVELSSGNHYAVNDWNPASAPHQVRSPIRSKPAPVFLMHYPHRSGSHVALTVST